MYYNIDIKKLIYKLFINGEAAFNEILICWRFPLFDTGRSDNLKILVELPGSFDDGVIPLVESELND